MRYAIDGISMHVRLALPTEWWAVHESGRPIGAAAFARMDAGDGS